MIQQYYKIEGFKPTLDLRTVSHIELNKILAFAKEKVLNFSELQKLSTMLWDNRDSAGFNIDDFVINELDIEGKAIKKKRLTGSFYFFGFVVKNVNLDYEPSMENFMSGNELKLFFNEIAEMGLIPGRGDTILNNVSWPELCKIGMTRNCVINRQFNWFEVRIDPMKDSPSGQIIPVCISFKEFVP